MEIARSMFALRCIVDARYIWDDWRLLSFDCGPGRPPSTIRHGNRGRPDLGTPCCGHWGMFFWVLQDRQTYSESAGSSAPERAWEADNRDHRGLSTQVMRDQWRTETEQGEARRERQRTASSGA